eukprot:TRINITY_DN3478_c0_g1_i1.p1 TRINITY_DN3478_c0_g1~~TRINITY_DN3478_c0_g1_i1.p1  ORF type:complete len:890 (+),score=436.83 TRINITY_DN3478_c0_g1_i1:264-2933(+)
MTKKNKKTTGKGRLDKYYQMAKEQGYRARSAFKLVQLNKKYDFLASSKAILDLCAAPGGWCQVAAKHAPVSSIIVGVDLMPIKPIHNVKTIQGDITTAKTASEIRKSLNKWKVDLVLHDGSPNMGQSWAQDAYSQAELVLASLKLATEFLMKDGWFVTKVFRSNEYNSVLWVLQQLFRKVEATKPSASRNASAEIFVVCQGYLEPKKIDPKMLDPKFVFGDLDTPAKQTDVFHKKLSKRPSRVGYEDGATLLHKTAPVVEFVTSKDPVPMLANFGAFTFDGDSAIFKTHRATTPEILTLCEDLKVLGKGDFKRLLRWRLVMAQFKDEQDGVKPKEAKVAPELTPEEIEANLTEELDARIEKLKAKKSKVARKEAERRAKLQRRIDAKMVLPEDRLDDQDESLFSLHSVKGDTALRTVTDSETPDGFEEDEPEEPAGSDDEPVDSENEENYAISVEESLDRMYEEYQERKGKARALKPVEDDDLHAEDAFNPARLQKKIPGFKPRVSGEPLASDDEDDDEDAESDSEMEVDTEGPANSLIVEEKEEPLSISRRAAMWFDQGIFKDIKEDEAEDADIQEMKKKIMEKSGVKLENEDSSSTPDAPEGEEPEVRLGPYFKSESGASPAHDSKKKRKNGIKPEPEVSDDEDNKRPKKPKRTGPEPLSRKQQLKQLKRSADGDGELDADEEQAKEGFEEVPMDNYLEDMDDDQRATALAIGSLMVNHKKMKQDIIDSAYNRYAFNDPGLPRWFTDEEAKHNQPTMPVTKDEVNAMKRRMREINARPIKKVAEAKARKKMRAVKKLESVKSQANAIAASATLKPGEKMQAIERLKKKAKLGKRPERKLVVSRKSGGVAGKSNDRGGGRVKRVDGRMKKEVRAKLRAGMKGKGKGRR